MTNAVYAEKNYSERLVAIPGLGVYPILPEVHDHGRSERVAAPADKPIFVNCVWFAQKFECLHLLTLRQIAEQAKRPFRFRLFVGPGLGINNHVVAFRQDMEEVIGKEYIELVFHVPYVKYQRILKDGDFR